jgi:hypothetical protein
LQFLGVNLDGDKDAALETASQFPLLRDQIFDGAGFDGPLATELCLTMIGSLYIIDKDGVLVDASGHDTAHHKMAGLRKKSGMALITDVTQPVGPDLVSGRELPVRLPTHARPDTRSGTAKSTDRVTSVNNTGIGGAK